MSERLKSISTRRRNYHRLGNHNDNKNVISRFSKSSNVDDRWSRDDDYQANIRQRAEKIVAPSTTSSYESASTFMVDDKHYLQYLLHGTIPDNSDGMSLHLDDVKCAKGCARFSLIGIIFLTFVGFLIEKQSVYLKGIKPKSYYYSNNYNRNMKNRSNENLYSRRANKNNSFKDVMGDNLSPNNARRRLEMQLGNIDLTINGRKKEQDEKEENNVFSSRKLMSVSKFYFPSTDDGENMNNMKDNKMHELAKTSFKTAAAYLFTMVLCIFYVRKRGKIVNISIRHQFIKRKLQLRQCFGSLFYRYRRRHYSDIPDLAISRNVDASSYHYNGVKLKKRKKSYGSSRVWEKLFGDTSDKRKNR